MASTRPPAKRRLPSGSPALVIGTARWRQWLFDNQATLTRDRVKEGLEEIAQVTDFDAQYNSTLEAVRTDAQLGQKLQINGTPTFFINGIRIASTLRPSYFDAAIAYELKRTQGASLQGRDSGPGT